MAVRDALAPVGSGGSGADREAAVVAEGVSKRYPRDRVMIFPPIVSMFERDLFKRRRSSEDADPKRKRRPAEGDDLDDDEFDDEDDFDDEERLPPPPPGAGETFWALRDVSFQVPPGAGLGVLGPSGSGKSTLLRILGGRAFPTEGRVLVRGRVSPPLAGLGRELKKGGYDLVNACRLLGIDGRLMKQHLDEIEELAQPGPYAEGEADAEAITRLAVATTVVLPANVILLDEPPGLDPAFAERVVEILRERLRSGSSLVLASQSPDLVRELCDESILLDQGSSAAEPGRTKGAVRAYEAAESAGDDRAGNGASAGAGTLAPARHLSLGRKLRVPRVVTAFHEWAALLSAGLRTAADAPSKRVDAADELSVEICFETALPDIEAHCGVEFRPRGGETGVRLELPQPLRFADPGTYVLVGHAPGGTLRTGIYDIRADAIVANPAERGARVIARDAGRVRVTGDDLSAAEPAGEPVAHWDGRASWRAEAEWSVEQQPRKRRT